MVGDCPLCGMEKEESAGFCNFHNSALTNLETSYTAWRRAFGNLEREEYYSKLETLQDVGSAVKEVIQYLRRVGLAAVRP